MKLHIANFYDAPRHTVFAGEDIAVGAVIKLEQGANAGVRRARQVTDADAALLVKGNYGIAVKVSVNPLQVAKVEYGVPLEWGSRVEAIRTGDYIIQAAPGSILEYDLSLLHSSLDPARAGTLPQVGHALAIKDGLLCRNNVASAITTPVIARVFDMIGGKVRVELV
jgi:hypothetical protein